MNYNTRFIKHVFMALTLTTLSCFTVAQETVEHQDLTITVRGSDAGPDIIFIPGLTSHWTTFEDVCAALEGSYRCHLVQLPGFAGYEPMNSLEDGFLRPLRDQLVAYLVTLPEPVTLVGHSLGGTMAMDVTALQPELISRMVLVDALPFLPVVQNPAATPELMQPMAARMRSAILSQSREQFEARVPMNIMGLTRRAEYNEVLLDWGLTTDQATLAYAMYDMQTLDLRPMLARIEAPTLILGAWAAYESYGATEATTRATFEQSYRQLSDKTIKMSESGYHFLMWDDPVWLIDNLRHFMEQS
jgi:pimeloyl-ACP methyl ester carboxylesterase